MKVRLVKSGGFAGVNERAECDVSELNQEAQTELQHFVAANPTGFRREKGPICDAFCYELQVEDERRKCTFSFDSFSFPKEIKSLMRELEDRAS